ncbi:CocE/NonD family hydrolase [Sphingobium sp.]|uniref:CocE/NonD family hydrolase n=1 Tax=Sphingobium sp. TaxID=1912891 RepID=UPI0028BDDBB9|nr:CocE/NonD family hydrolase [Sphingobium sp.]
MILISAIALFSDVSEAKPVGIRPNPPVSSNISDNPLDLLKVRDIATIEQGVPVMMRDGTRLLATIVRPKSAAGTQKLPTILVQTPYLIAKEVRGQALILGRLVRSGYALVVINDRGTHWSEGEYHWMKNVRADGADSIKWITRQPWSDGGVGTFGCSSSGEVALPLATEQVPGLKATVAMAAATAYGVIPGFEDQGVFYTGGVPVLSWAMWYRKHGQINHPKLPPDISQQEREALISTFPSLAVSSGPPDLDWTNHLPSQDMMSAAGAPLTEFDRLIRMKPNDPAWKDYDFINAGDRMKSPVLHVSSWYDAVESLATIKGYEYVSANSPDQYLVMGGTSHCDIGTETAETMVGQRPIGDARFDIATTVVKWFDHWMKKDGKGGLDMPKVQYYPLESSNWTKDVAWPPRSSPTRFYLDSRRGANGLGGDGRLMLSPPQSGRDRFKSDPLNPVPSLGGGCCDDNVGRDQREIEKRDDVLVYTTEPFDRTVKIAGDASVTLYLSSSVWDTDLAIKLVDVYPDGRAFNILDTMKRLRYRNGIDREEMLVPGKLYKIEINSMTLASHFAPGHRIRLEIAGSNFPLYERNLHSGGNNHDETKAMVAHNIVYHDAAHPSALTLPVID